jgi:ParB-like chromosome segregation protein Spo0J
MAGPPTASQYQLLPDLTEDEYEALKADIAERGVQVPVERDETGAVLDGHHRIRACEELGITEYPTIIRTGMTDDEKRQHVLALNLDRRHLTGEQRTELTVKLRALGMSLRAIAEVEHVTQTTVARDLAGVTNVTPDAEPPAKVTGADGKQYPATRPKPTAVITTTPRQTQAALDILQTGTREPLKPLSTVAELEAQSDPAAEQRKPPHIAANSGDNEWYTPEEYINAAREVMGGIDFDPASSETANTVVQADVFCSAEDDGLKHPWAGRVWMNPPYAQPLIEQFSNKLVASVGAVTEAVVLVNNATETRWFQTLARASSAICFPAGRVRFWAPDKPCASPLQGQAVLYIGDHVHEFAEAFGAFGVVVRA